MKILLLILASLVVGCGSQTCDEVVAPVLIDTAYASTMQGNLMKWQDAKIDCYEYELEYRRSQGPPVALIQVEHGRVIRVVEDGVEFRPPLTATYPTIDTLFAFIDGKQHGVDGIPWSIEAIYDGHYGIPLSLDAWPAYPPRSDSNDGFRINSFVRLPCQ